MIEVESKCRVNNSDELLSSLYARARYLGERYNHDEYYTLKSMVENKTPLSDISQENIIRLRHQSTSPLKEGGQYYLTRKIKHIQRGIEINQEEEIKIDKGEECKTILSFLGYACFVTKIKHSRLFELSEFRLELNWMGVLGFFLEVEKLCQHKSQVNQAMDTIKQIFYEFGFSEKDFVKDRYIDLLWQHDNKT